MAGLFSRPKIETPPVTKVEPPPTTVVEEDDDTIKRDVARRQKDYTRPKSIITGDLTPAQLGKKRLLGGS